MPSFSSISAVWLRVDQSDLEPMITPTSALIVVPLIGRPQARLKTTSHAGEPAWLVVRIMTDLTGQRPRSIPQSGAFKAPAITFCQQPCKMSTQTVPAVPKGACASYVMTAHALPCQAQSATVRHKQYLFNCLVDI
ncbi:hypothetical protein AO354_26245 [Pseudomonas syringae pv. syringae]|nr:hypothetical protein AO354_26245 [Pseudomonas syringae pv. syringae]